MKEVMRFGKKGKLSPRYVGPYRILKRIGKVAYELELTADLVARFQISDVTGGTHGHHPHTVDGLTVRPAGPWFVTEKFPRTQLRKLAKSRLTDRPTVRRSDHGPWSVFVDRDFPYQPLTQTTVDQHGPSFDPRSVGLTVDESQQPVS
ncbi:hypothetical protein MTR67_047819 [Solanum verrucosum]|uniref:Tf2-1-like SH3-like domain-containing protein n=1 Tax=Solanum verrucosum TaxID=315347 RepID=A0AAF0UZQ5_SOLVR|nr:hypothetical protein MTR67_047819 [Solanum verrucosum]